MIRTFVVISTWCVGLRLFPAFPYEPYPIQQDFMQALYETIDNEQIGLFESPTGAAAIVDLAFLKTP